MGSKDSNLEREVQSLERCQLRHFPVRLEHVSRTVFLAGEVRLELTHGQLQRLLAYRLAHSPMVERPGIEPGPSVLQTDAQTMYAISRWLRRLVPPHIMVAASRVELEGRGYEPRCVTRRTPHRKNTVLDAFSSLPCWMVFSRDALVEGTGLEPVLPAYQTGILTVG